MGNYKNSAPAKIWVALAMVGLSACSWFGARKPLPVDPTELIVSGAPAESIVFVDGTQAGNATPPSAHSQVILVTPGDHTVEIHVGDKVVYREETFVPRGDRRVVNVLSGAPN